MQLLGAQRILQDDGHEKFGREKRQAGELQIRAVGDGVAQLYATVRGEADDVARIGFVHRLTPLAQKRDHAGGAQFFGGALHLELHARCVFARRHAHEGDAVAVVGVHIGLHLEHHARKRAVFGLDFFDHGLFVDDQVAGAGLGRGGQIDQGVEHFHHPEVVHARAEEHGRLLARQEGGFVKRGRCAGGQLHAVHGGLPFQAKALGQLGLLGEGNGFEVLRQAFRARVKHRHGLRAQVDDAAKGFALAHRPGHGHTGHAQLALHLIQNIERVAHFAVHLVDEGDDGRVALSADLDQAAGLCFHTVGRVDHHQRRIHGRQHAVGVFREVLVAGGVEQVDDVLAVQHLHHGRRHRDATLLFDFHPVAGGVTGRFARFDRAGDLDRAREQQELFGQRGFARVGVGNDGKRPAAPGFVGVGHKGS